MDKKKKKKGKYKVFLFVHILISLLWPSWDPQAPALAGKVVQVVLFWGGTAFALWGPIAAGVTMSVWFAEAQYSRVCKLQKVTAFIFSLSESCHLLKGGLLFPYGSVISFCNLYTTNMVGLVFILMLEDTQ